MKNNTSLKSRSHISVFHAPTEMSRIQTQTFKVHVCLTKQRAISRSSSFYVARLNATLKQLACSRGIWLNYPSQLLAPPSQICHFVNTASPWQTASHMTPSKCKFQQLAGCTSTPFSPHVEEVRPETTNHRVRRAGGSGRGGGRGGRGGGVSHPANRDTLVLAKRRF